MFVGVVRQAVVDRSRHHSLLSLCRLGKIDHPVLVHLPEHLIERVGLPDTTLDAGGGGSQESRGGQQSLPIDQHVATIDRECFTRKTGHPLEQVRAFRHLHEPPLMTPRWSPAEETAAGFNDITGCETGQHRTPVYDKVPREHKPGGDQAEHRHERHQPGRASDEHLHGGTLSPASQECLTIRPARSGGLHRSSLDCRIAPDRCGPWRGRSRAAAGCGGRHPQRAWLALR